MMAEYIDREAAVKAFNNFDAGRADSPPSTLLTTEEFAEYLYELPAADVAPVVHGKWLLDRWPSWPHRECSRCKIMIPRTTEVPDQYWQYCPNCGARMDGGNEGE